MQQIQSNLTPITKQTSAEVAAVLQQRFDSLKALDQSPQDNDRRDCYVSVERSDGRLEAVVAPLSDGFEYHARITQNGLLKSGECASVSQTESGPGVLASHYEEPGRAKSSDIFPDITKETSPLNRSLEQPELLISGETRQWSSTPGNEGKGVSTLSLVQDADERYYYTSNFDNMFKPE
jgi:hypothetical protein